MITISKERLHDIIATAYSMALINTRGIVDDKSQEWKDAISEGRKHADKQIELRERMESFRSKKQP